MIRRARVSARRACALTGLAQLRAGHTALLIRRANNALCRSEVVLMRIDAGDGPWTPAT